MFKIWIATNSGRGDYNKKFKGQVVVIVQKGYIWISQEALRHLSNSKYMCVLQNNTEWAIAPAQDGELGAYKVDSKKSEESGNPNVLRAGSFIKTNNIPTGYIYKGTPQDGMLVFSKTPSSKA